MGYRIVVTFCERIWRSLRAHAAAAQPAPHSAVLHAMPYNQSADQIIVMGLPKTGTTATAAALVDVGYHVAHNQGDKLSRRCQVIANTLESRYAELDQKHPNATWLITYSANASQWVDSVQAHVKRHHPPEKSLPCNFYGCAMGLADGVQKSFVYNATATATNKGNFIPEGALLELLAAYRLYYDRLFTYFQGRPYVLVDVREGKYVNLSHIHPAFRGPFKAKNTRDHPGQWPRCH